MVRAVVGLVVRVGAAGVTDRARGPVVKVAALVAGTAVLVAGMAAVAGRVAVAVAGMTTGLPGRDSASSPS